MKNYYIKLDGELVDLPSEQSVTLERYNPIFDFDTIRGAQVMNYMLPFSTRNDRIFGWYGLHHTRYSAKKYYCEKYADGILIEKGWVELSGVTDAGYQVFFSQNLGEFFGDFHNTAMNLIDFGSANTTPKLDYNYTTDAAAFPTVKNVAFYGDNQRAGYNGFVNEVVSGSYSSNCPIVPMVGLAHVFRKITTLCDVRFYGEFFDSDWYKRGLLDNVFSLDGLTEIQYQNHLYSLTIPEFLKELAKLANCVIYMDSVNRTIRLRFREERMNQATAFNLTEKVLPSKAKAPDRSNRLELDWQLDGGDNLMKVVPSDFLKYQTPGVDENFFKIHTKFSTRQTDTTGLAMAEQIGITSLFNQKGSAFTPKLLFWNGVVNGIPTATNSHGNLRLAWHGPNSLATNWQYFEAFRSKTAPRNLSVRLTSADLARLDYHVTGGTDSVVHIYGRDFYIENIRINLPITNYATLKVWEK
jgi:hypothetical protein